MAGFTNSSLTDYVEENKGDLILEAVIGAPTLSYPIDIIQGIKYKQAFNFLAVTAPFQTGTTCAFNSSGDVTFTQSVITVTDVKVQNQFCPKTLESKYTQKFLRPGAHQEELPVGKFITDQTNALIKAQMEQALWQGDTALTNLPNLKIFDGWLKRIDAGSPVIATATADVTTGNIISIIDNMYTLLGSNLPAIMSRPDLVLVMGKDSFQLLVLALRNLNYFHIDVNQSLQSWELNFPTYGLKVIGVDGLSNIAGTQSTKKDRMVLTYWDNLVFGTDLQSDYENYEMWYSKDDRVIKLSAEWKAGTAVKKTTEVITYKNS